MFLDFPIALFVLNVMYVLNSFASWVHCGKLVTSSSEILKLAIQ
jgi:hypothetical protein